MPDPALILQNLLIGLVDGSLYVVVALGLTLLFGVSRVINLAHGEFVAIGGYITFIVVTTIALGPLVGIVAAIAAGFALGWATDRLLLRPIRRRPQVKLPLELFLILTLGLSLFLQNGLLALFGDNYLQTEPLVRGSIDVLGAASLSSQRLLVLALSIALVASLFTFLTKTRMGTAIRAASQDRDAARSVGIEVERLDSTVFGISAALAAAAGSLVTPLIFLYPAVGLQWMIKGIIVVIMGGLGNPLGALIDRSMTRLAIARSCTYNRISAADTIRYAGSFN